MFETLINHMVFGAFLRPIGMFVMFPVLGSKNLGSSLIRNGLIIAFSIPVIPFFINTPIVLARTSASEWLGFDILLQELVIGAVLGFAVSMAFWALDSAGFIIDTIRGSSMGTVLNPSLGEPTSVMGILFVQLFITLFFMHGGLNNILQILYTSYAIIPPGAEIKFGSNWATLIVAIWHPMFSLCLSFVLPAVIVMVLTDLAVGLINRTAQQLNVFFIAMPLKSVMALFMLATSMYFSFEIYFKHIDQLPDTISTLLQGIMQ
ncbi:type III secretion system export apparatus subunit SctT [Enterobacter hormaechei]|nr:EscT/YscT/HrcT family type III secretion system export apparatus protein [Enterobacter hormaechei]